jgi:excisionase family DNA binding protein
MNASAKTNQRCDLSKNALPHLARVLKHHSGQSAKTSYELRVEGTDAVLPVPSEALELFADILRAMAAGEDVQVLRSDRLLTTQQAADLLNLSRTYLLQRIEAGDLKVSMVGSHRRLKFSDVLVYKRKMHALRESKLAEIAAIDQELGLDEL